MTTYLNIRFPKGLDLSQKIVSNNDVDAIIAYPLNVKWLLTFDNVDREYCSESGDPEVFDVKEYLPKAVQGSILITSRLASKCRLVGKEIRLEPIQWAIRRTSPQFNFGEKLCRVSLNKNIFSKVTSNFWDFAGSLKLVNLHQGLLLAVVQAGLYTRETGTSALQYMKLYEETWGELMIQQHQFALHDAAARNVLATWTVSFNDLERKCPDTDNLLALYTILDNQYIWHELFTLALDSKSSTKLPDWYPRCVGSQLGLNKYIRVLICMYGTLLWTQKLNIRLILYILFCIFGAIAQLWHEESRNNLACRYGGCICNSAELRCWLHPITKTAPNTLQSRLLIASTKLIYQKTWMGHQTFY